MLFELEIELELELELNNNYEKDYLIRLLEKFIKKNQE
jgi:hypothetical protein